MSPSSLPNLKDQFIDGTYDGLLHTANESLSSSDLKRIFDGSGNPTPIKISSDGVTLGTVPYALTASVEGSVLTYENGTTSFQSLLNAVYPIGSVYFSVNDTDPSVLFRGSWRRIGQGRFIASVGEGDDGIDKETIFAGETIGSYRHTLTTDEIPSHNHTPSDNLDFPYVVTWWQKGTINRQEAGSKNNSSYSFPSRRPEAQELSQTGGDLPHNNIPPAFGLYVWERIS